MNREQVIALAREAGVFSGANEFVFAASLERFAALVAAQEREACAALVQSNALACDPGSMLQVYLASNAAAIRARKEET